VNSSIAYASCATCAVDGRPASSIYMGFAGGDFTSLMFQYFVCVQAASAHGEGFMFGMSDSDDDDSPAGGENDDDDDGGGRDGDRSRCTTS